MAIARTVAAAMASRADLTLDQVEDVRLAMDEATAHLISAAASGATIECELSVLESGLQVKMHCAISSPPPDPEPFSWTVLTTLVEDVSLHSDGAALHMQWQLLRDHSVQA